MFAEAFASGDRPPSEPPIAPPNPTRPQISCDPFGFPDCRHVVPLAHFASRWTVKREHHARFVRAIEAANRNLPPGWRLPDELVADWLAQWVDSVFAGHITALPGMTAEQLAVGVEDMAGLVEAVWFTEQYANPAAPHRFWCYELEVDPWMNGFPTVEQIRRHRPDLDPQAGAEYRPAHWAVGPNWGQQRFLERISYFTTSPPSARDSAWLRRIAYQTDARQPLRSDPPRHLVWVRRQLQRVVPELAAQLGISQPRLEDGSDTREIVRRVHNWVAVRARPRLAAIYRPPQTVVAVETADPAVEPLAEPHTVGNSAVEDRKPAPEPTDRISNREQHQSSNEVAGSVQTPEVGPTRNCQPNDEGMANWSKAARELTEVLGTMLSRLPPPAVAESKPEMPGDDTAFRIIGVYANGVADERIVKAAKVVGDHGLTANEKLVELDRLMPIPSTASSYQLGNMLGVTPQAVRRCAWWEENRKGGKNEEIAQRERILQARRDGTSAYG